MSLVLRFSFQDKEVFKKIHISIIDKFFIKNPNNKNIEIFEPKFLREKVVPDYFHEKLKEYKEKHLDVTTIKEKITDDNKEENSKIFK